MGGYICTGNNVLYLNPELESLVICSDRVPILSLSEKEVRVVRDEWGSKSSPSGSDSRR